MPPPTKRRKTHAVEEITFDLTAREDYLTGFHKRKLQRAKHAQDEAAKRAREEKIVARKQIREQRKRNIEEHVEAVNALLRKARDEDSDNYEDEKSEANDTNDKENEPALELGTVAAHEDEYIDEDKYTTVTVQAMDASRDQAEEWASGDESDAQGSDGDGNGPEVSYTKEATGENGTNKRRPWTKEKPSTAKPKKKKNKFRYESKVERKATRTKQSAKNSAAAKARRGTT